ncbi:MAG: flagellar basal body rod protein FlgC [Deltaproteobacteria bacterium]|nr:MAG: flagellar basal body rod protein FlgC [Deltaproteobacteria bacterium]
MDLFTAMEISASGLSAQRVRMNVASSNLANVQTTRTAGGGPYQRKNVVLRSQSVPGASGSFAGAVRAVEVAAIQPDGAPPRYEYDPGHPDANADGYVAYPDINVVEEMVDMITASRAYEAGVTALGTSVAMAERAIGIGR